MSLSKRIPILASLLLVLVAGCKFELGTLKKISTDISLWNSKLSSDDNRWQTLPAEGWPVITCVGPEAMVSDCCQLPAAGPQVDCQKVASECDQALNQCVLYFVYQESATIDLLKEAPALDAQKDQIPQQVLLQSVTSAFTSDFEWPLPTVGMYVAPATAKDIADPQAVYLAAIPPQSGTVVLDDAAQLAFSNFAVNFRTPFKLFFASTIKVVSGPRPQGTLAIALSGRVEASF
jgi:hypothetical protein